MKEIKNNSYDDVHSTYMETEKILADNLALDVKKFLDLGAEVTVIDITEIMQ